MKIACLVDQRPKIGHVFIRREILAVEKEGVEILCRAIRRSAAKPMDWRDIEEAARTHTVLDAGWLERVRAILRVKLARLGRFARARPVLSTFVAGIPEMVVPGRNGWLVPAGSVDDLAAGLRRILDAPLERLTEMGLRGREDVSRQHDIFAIARDLVAHFRATIAAESPPARQPRHPAGMSN